MPVLQTRMLQMMARRCINSATLRPIGGERRIVLLTLFVKK